MNPKERGALSIALLTAFVLLALVLGGEENGALAIPKGRGGGGRGGGGWGGGSRGWAGGR